MRNRAPGSGPMARGTFVLSISLLRPAWCMRSLSALCLDPNLRRASTLLPHSDLPLLVERGQRIAPHLAQQLVVIAQAIRANALAHRASGLLGMAAIAEPTTSGQCPDVVVRGRE